MADDLTELLNRFAYDIERILQDALRKLVHDLDSGDERTQERAAKDSRDDYEQMRAGLVEELNVVEEKLMQARLEVVDIEKVLDFAENLLVNAAGVWQQCSLEQKQRLQQVLFPQGVEYENGIYRTQETSFLFKDLRGVPPQDIRNGSATGNRTRV
jgi:site-specific DNA recombinase